MQQAGATPTQQHAAVAAASTSTPFFAAGASSSSATTSSFFALGRLRNNTRIIATDNVSSKSRPNTSSGNHWDPHNNFNSPAPPPPTTLAFEHDREREREQPRNLTKERKLSFSRKYSFAPSRSKRRTNSSSSGNSIFSPSSAADGAGGLGASNGGGGNVITNRAAPPALPDFALAVAAKISSRDSEFIVHSPASVDSFSKMLSRTAPTPTNGYNTAAPSTVPSSAQTTESAIIYGHIQDTSNKRISTLHYLRKAHEGRVYWFNTLLFTQGDLSRMPSLSTSSAPAAAKVARRATNYLLLGLSLPPVIDFSSNTPTEFLRTLNALLIEFEAFQALHSDGFGGSGVSASSLTRAARIPQMFRRVQTAGVGKTRRTSGQASDIGLPLGSSSGSTASLAISNVGATDAYSVPISAVGGGGGLGGGSGGSGFFSGEGGISAGASAGVGYGGSSSTSTGAVMQFGAAESELLPGEEYTHLLTPNLPFDPDFFETFATLCDVLIDAYTKLMSLLPTPRECNGIVADLFAKADAKIRKIIVQGCVKEFEEYTRAGIRNEVASVGKVVLAGLM